MNKPQIHFAHPACKCGSCAASRGFNVNHTVASFDRVGPTSLGQARAQHIAHQSKVSNMASFESALAIQQAMYRNDKPNYTLLAISARELGLVTDGLSEAIMVIYRRLHELSYQPSPAPLYQYQLLFDFHNMSPRDLQLFELDPAIRYLLSNDVDVERLRKHLADFEKHWKRAFADLPVIQLLNDVGPWRFVALNDGLFEELIQQQYQPYSPRNTVIFRSLNERVVVKRSTEYAQLVREALAHGGLSKISCHVAMNRLATLHLTELESQQTK